MLVHTYGAKCTGIEATKVITEVSIENGIGIHLCGLADVAVKESLLRTTTALEAMGFRIPGKKIVINLAPADLHKNGSGYDLPIAIGIIASSAQMDLPYVGDFLIMGELGLDGTVRDIPGALIIAELAKKEHFAGCILPESSAMEAVELTGIRIFGVRALPDVLRILQTPDMCGDLLISEISRTRPPQKEKEVAAGIDFCDIIGQNAAKRAAEIAVSGQHNLIMIGPQGSGKSSIAKAIAGIMPPMTRQEALVTSKIYSVAGKGTSRMGLMWQRPFRSPHISASIAAMIGGGGGDNAMPGEVSLAMNGVLFVDEFGEAPRSMIEALRGPLEDRKVCISRLRSKVEYPASFMLVAASNPCPCGHYGDGDRCICSVGKRNSYLEKLSGPVMDRIDLQVFLTPNKASDLRSRSVKPENSAAVAERVIKAREIQNKRFIGEQGVNCNAEMNNKLIEKYCPLSDECASTLEKLMDNMHISMRAYFRIIKVARTIADLAGAENIEPAHIIEAAGFRFLDKIGRY